MIRWAYLLGLWTGLSACVGGATEDLSSLADKPALPFSVLVTGGGFVAPHVNGGADAARARLRAGFRQSTTRFSSSAPSAARF